METACEHCGTTFRPGPHESNYCCAGCRFVAGLIADSGLGQYYNLKGGDVGAPVSSRPFLHVDTGWVAEAVARAENSTSGEVAEGSFDITGLSCIGCVWLVEELFSRHPGGVQARVDVVAGRVALNWKKGGCDLQEFAAELQRFGYLLCRGGGARPGGAAKALVGKIGLCAAFALNGMAFTLPTYLGMSDTFPLARLFTLVVAVSATLSLLVGGSFFIVRAWQGLRSGVLSIDLPIAVGIGAAYAGSVVGWLSGAAGLVYFDFVAVFILLMLLGRYLQSVALERNQKRLRAVSPVADTVLKIVGEETEETPLEEIGAGDSFRLLPGQIVPVAARVSAGATVGLEWITGEAEPQTLAAGARVPSGAVNIGRAPLDVEAAESWEESLLYRLTRERGEEKPGDRFMAQILQGYIAVVLAVGVGGFAYWLWAGAGVQAALQVMISLFVVSCPCALGVAVPLADDVAATTMERAGVFVRQSGLWAKLSRLGAVFFDKTGTLTLENPQLENPGALGEMGGDERVALNALVRDSLHPVARGLVEALAKFGRLPAQVPLAISEVVGMGVRGTAPDGTVWSLGRPGWAADGEGNTDDGQWDSVFARDGQAVGRFRFHDEIRPESVRAIAALASSGTPVYVLSGDRPEKVADVGAQLGVPEQNVFGGLTPEEKAGLVRERWPGAGATTLYLGDGANDSLAFDSATLCGTPVADRGVLERKADFYFLSRGLGFLPEMVAVCRRRRRAVRAVFVFAVVYNLAAAAICLAGRMNPLLAAVIMPLSSVVTIGLVAVLMGDRVRKKRKNRGRTVPIGAQTS